MNASRPLLAVAIAAWLILSGCTARYFQAADAPTAPPRYALAQWPYDEYWTGLVFNGEKIGFSHLKIEPVQGGLYRIRSEAALRLRFLGFDKRMHFQTEDWVRADLTLVRFDYRHEIDGSRRTIVGRVADGVLRFERNTGGRASHESIPLASPVVPASVINLHPFLQGLELGRSTHYRVFDGETQSVAEVSQSILAYESSDLFEGSAFKVETRLHGQKVTSWLRDDGKPVFEMSLNGVLISALEPEQAAVRYLAQAALNKEESLLEYSRVPSDRRIERPRAVTHLIVELSGAAFESPPIGGAQRCEVRPASVRCVIDVPSPPTPSGRMRRAGDDLHLRSTDTVPTAAPAIRQRAWEIAGEKRDDWTRVEALIAWIGAHIEPTPADVFSALDVLEGRRAECQGHAYLFAALARALGIPTKVVNGLVYSGPEQGFFYHTWVESRIGGRWIPIDPTFRQTRADATHVTLIEGETPAELVSLAGFLGRLTARVIEVTHRE